jgi:hypothetical protein
VLAECNFGRRTAVLVQPLPWQQFYAAPSNSSKTPHVSCKLCFHGWGAANSPFANSPRQLPVAFFLLKTDFSDVHFCNSSPNNSRNLLLINQKQLRINVLRLQRISLFLVRKLENSEKFSLGNSHPWMEPKKSKSAFCRVARFRL